MSAERIYAALLCLYPRRFRARYGPEAMQTFTALSAAMDSHRARFWWRVLTDVARSIVREHIDDWTFGDLPLTIRWIAGCVTSLLIFRLIFIDPAYSTRTRFITDALSVIPVWAKGLLLVAALGAGQGWALKQGFRVAGLWSMTIALAAGTGGAVVSGVAALFTLLRYQPIDVHPDERGLLLTLNMLGIAVAFGLPLGVSQAILLGRLRGTRWIRLKDAMRVIGWTTVAIPAALILSRLALQQVFRPANDWWWRLITVVVQGAILGLLTVRPIARMVGRENRCVE